MGKVARMIGDGLVCVQCIDIIHFLQGITTNDCATLERRGARPQYSALLNSQGRFLYDMHLHRTREEKRVLLADVDKQSVPDLIKLLRRYKLRANVDVADVSDEHAVWVRFGADAEGVLQPDCWPPDARYSTLGQRKLLPRGDDSCLLQDDPVADPAAYQQWRFEHGIAEGAEIPAGSAVPLEYNLDGLRGISFTKGCYVGQELIARAHFRGVVRKRLMPLALAPGADAAALSPGADVHARGAVRPVGRMALVAPPRALAVLRLQPALAAAAAALGLQKEAYSGGEPAPELHIGGTGDGPIVVPRRPEWWPATWGHEDTGDAAAQAAAG
ncbi:hypothetical protein WJX81_005172 [Elliptochloris bilobata]|uniref:CAF17 C-terminal domain-containing protein n=1 Tax=Elliptochloris bilobata TaxID=381761 RepID=A0AAW1S9S9_9CHLO